MKKSSKKLGEVKKAEKSSCKVITKKNDTNKDDANKKRVEFYLDYLDNKLIK